MRLKYVVRESVQQTRLEARLGVQVLGDVRDQRTEQVDAGNADRGAVVAQHLSGLAVHHGEHDQRADTPRRLDQVARLRGAAHVGEGAHAPLGVELQHRGAHRVGRRFAGAVGDDEDFGEALGLRRRFGTRRLLRPRRKTLRRLVAHVAQLSSEAQIRTLS